jgi:hypothetical protein
MIETSPTASSWGLAEIPYGTIMHDSIRHRDDLLYLLAASSFVEILSDLTTQNLIQFFDGDEEVGRWLSTGWERDEVRHGQALRDYVRAVWPEFDWDAAYRNFFAEYSKLCTVEEMAPTRCLEMAARCVVEMGTAGYYHALEQFAPEPVLRDLAGRIKNDEVRHYKHFYRYFLKYRVLEGPGRRRILAALVRRLGALRSEDAEIAIWHAYQSAHPTLHKESPEFRTQLAAISAMVRAQFPAGMAIKMLLKPLYLPPVLRGLVSAPLALLTQRWVLR